MAVIVRATTRCKCEHTSKLSSSFTKVSKNGHPGGILYHETLVSRAVQRPELRLRKEACAGHMCRSCFVSVSVFLGLFEICMRFVCLFVYT